MLRKVHFQLKFPVPLFFSSFQHQMWSRVVLSDSFKRSNLRWGCWPQLSQRMFWYQFQHFFFKQKKLVDVLGLTWACSPWLTSGIHLHNHHLHLFGTEGSSYFSAAVIKYHVQKELRERVHFDLMIPTEIRVHHGSKQRPWQPKQEPECSHVWPQTQSRDSELGWCYEISKPMPATYCLQGCTT